MPTMELFPSLCCPVHGVPRNNENRCPECAKTYQKKYQKGYMLKRRYGIDELDYELMLLEQNDLCRLCERPFGSSPHVDHCHTTERVRGLLCSGCNTGLGSMKDSSAAARNALGYLLRPDDDFPWEIFC